jgi:hypothetical protein
MRVGRKNPWKEKAMLKHSLKVLGCVILAVGLLGPAGPAKADWYSGDPHKMHYPQLPDLSDNALGVDLKPGWLADDFLCTGSGPITDIHLWIGSESGFLPGNPNTYPLLRVKIYSDIPASESSTGYSMPGTELWTRDFDKDHYTLRLLAEDLGEGINQDQSQGLYTYNIEEIWQVNIPIEEELFNQEEGTTYWLVLFDLNPNDNFWMTSTDHWNDDAVYGYPPEWYDLTYPDGHLYAGDSMDMAFVLNTPLPGSVLLLGSGLLGLSLLGWRRKRT